MALNIKNKEVEELARELADSAQCSQVEILLRALRRLREELQAEREQRVERRRRALVGWVEEMRRSPLAPSASREAAESELYDEQGLPK